MNKSIAEFIGTFALVFFGCGAAVVGSMGSGPGAINLLGIASAFGFAIVAMAYGIGPISGCHVNPAVSFGVFVAGRMSANEMIRYWIAQVLGAIVAAAVLYLILSGKAQGWNGGLGQNGWGPGYIGEYNVVSAFVFEVVGTFLGRHPSRRHQHHRHLGQSGPLDRPRAGRHRLEPATLCTALALHYRPADRRGRCRFPLQGKRRARRQEELKIFILWLTRTVEKGCCLS